jgi:hypothetical protein
MRPEHVLALVHEREVLENRQFGVSEGEDLHHFLAVLGIDFGAVFGTRDAVTLTWNIILRFKTF